MSIIIYGGTKKQIERQLACHHNWHGPCMDDRSKYNLCIKCLTYERDLTYEEYHEQQGHFTNRKDIEKQLIYEEYYEKYKEKELEKEVIDEKCECGEDCKCNKEEKLGKNIMKIDIEYHIMNDHTVEAKLLTVAPILDDADYNSVNEIYLKEDNWKELEIAINHCIKETQENLKILNILKDNQPKDRSVTIS